MTKTDTAPKEIILDGLVTKEHFFEVPLDYAAPTGKKIRVFGREVVSPANASRKDLPWLVWFTGGPGFAAPRPESADGWLKRALKEFRVFLLDERGTGLSSPVSHEIMEQFATPQDQANYLQHFRADNIVRDAEYIRKTMVGDKWTALGQSYGGFCITTYLSLAPEGLASALITGGIPPLVSDPDPAYRATYKQVIKKNELFYKRFSADKEKIRAIVDHLRNHEVYLPSGERFTVNRFLQLGLNLGFRVTGSSLNALHYLLERAFLDEPKPRISYYFLRQAENMLSFNTNPIYAILHEQIYCEGKPSNWSADRLLPEFAEFAETAYPCYFLGEMVYPWMFDDYICLRPLKAAAEILAKKSDWPKLYDVEMLNNNTVPTAAAIYVDDMYVDFELSMQMAKNIRGIKLWITNEYEHDGIRADGERVVDRLLAMSRGEIS